VTAASAVAIIVVASTRFISDNGVADAVIVATSAVLLLFIRNTYRRGANEDLDKKHD
jgi:hypothetical protein